jgi:hypothetical protein
MEEVGAAAPDILIVMPVDFPWPNPSELTVLCREDSRPSLLSAAKIYVVDAGSSQSSRSPSRGRRGTDGLHLRRERCVPTVRAMPFVI